MKGHAKRWLSMLVVLCMIFTLAVPMYAAAQTEDITILYTNDIHTYINNGQVGDGDQTHDSWSYSRLASYKESLGENTLWWIAETTFRELLTDQWMTERIS